MKPSNKLLWIIFLLVSFGTVSITTAQEQDSVKTEPTTGPVWFKRPPSGGAEKTQGGVLMALGGVSAIVGIIRLNEKDPCDDISGPGVICTSNIDEIHAIGAASLAIGIGASIFGIVRYANGVQKAKVYEDWKRKNKVSIRPDVKFEREQVLFAVLIEF